MQLGYALKNIYILDKFYEVYGLSKPKSKEKNYFQCDINDVGKLEKIFKIIKPHIIINSAALVNVDICETNKDLAYKINFLGNKNLINLAKKYNSFFVFVSSYYVFEGNKKNYKEEDYLSPLNYYGITKAMAEIETSSYKKSLIIRPSKIFGIGYDNRNLIARSYNSLKNKKKVFVVNDQFNNPIGANFIAKSMKQLISLEKKGIYNIGGKDCVSNFELVERFAKYFDMDYKLVISKKSNKLNQTVKRPSKVNLALNKIKLVKIKTYSLNSMFKSMKEELKDGEKDKRNS